MRIAALGFDLDGTITTTNVHFGPFRSRIGCTENDILAFIDAADQHHQHEYRRVLDDYEAAIQHDCELQPGFFEVMAYCTAHGIKTGIVTRSSRHHAQVVMEKLGIPIEQVIGRDDAPPKPSGAPLIKLADMLTVPPESMLFVGDYLWDLLAGDSAGATTVLLLNDHNRRFARHAQYTITRLTDLIALMDTLRTKKNK